MANSAGAMSQTPPGNPNWVACNGGRHHGYAPLPNPARPHAGVSSGTRRDYWRNNGGWTGSAGIGGWSLRVPLDPGGTWFVSLEDDSAEVSVGAVTVRNPPAGVR